MDARERARRDPDSVIPITAGWVNFLLVEGFVTCQPGILNLFYTDLFHVGILNSVQFVPILTIPSLWFWQYIARRAFFGETVATSSIFWPTSDHWKEEQIAAELQDRGSLTAQASNKGIPCDRFLLVLCSMECRWCSPRILAWSLFQSICRSPCYSQSRLGAPQRQEAFPLLTVGMV